MELGELKEAKHDETGKVTFVDVLTSDQIFTVVLVWWFSYLAGCLIGAVYPW